MNFEQCFEILQDRQREGQSQLSHKEGESDSSVPSACPCLTSLTEHSSASAMKENSTAEELTDYEELPTLNLLEKFIKLQEERVAVYKEFDSSLQKIIEDGRIAEYSLLCGEVTARFQIISEVIIKLQNIFLCREGSAAEVGSCIQRLQKNEGEKLLLVAAEHMDIIRANYPAFAPHMGGRSATQTQKESYNTSERLKCEEKIQEEMENIMSEKCELLEA